MANSKKIIINNSIPSGYVVVLRKDFALKGIKSSWRNADSSLSRKINEEWKRRGRRAEDTERINLQSSKRCQLPDCVFTKVKKEGIMGRGGTHRSPLDTVTHKNPTQKGNCWQCPAKYFAPAGRALTYGLWIFQLHQGNHHHRVGGHPKPSWPADIKGSMPLHPPPSYLQGDECCFCIRKNIQSLPRLHIPP